MGVGLLFILCMLLSGLFFGCSSEMLLIMVKCLFEVVLVVVVFCVNVVGVKVSVVRVVRVRVWMECMGEFFWCFFVLDFLFWGGLNVVFEI